MDFFFFFFKFKLHPLCAHHDGEDDKNCDDM